ncbi:MAG: hypothetical protein ACRCZ0_01240 [Cetobacterium sp.]
MKAYNKKRKPKHMTKFRYNNKYHRSWEEGWGYSVSSKSGADHQGIFTKYYRLFFPNGIFCGKNDQ